MTKTLFFAGDVAISREQPSGAFGDVTPLIAEADFSFCNLEFPLTDRDSAPRGKIYPQKALPSSIGGLVEAGFSAVNLANNHMFDQGPDGWRDTVAALDGNGVGKFGTGESLDESARPFIVERDGLRVGVMGVSTTIPQGYGATDDRCGIYPLRVETLYRQRHNPDEYPGTAPIIESRPFEEDLERLKSDIGKARSQCDVLLLYVHWGTSMTEQVHDFQRIIGHAAIDAGVAGIFGGHQHVVCGVEYYRGVPIVHGMANLIFDLDVHFFDERTKRCVAFLADIDKNGLSNCRLVGCRTGSFAPAARMDLSSFQGQSLVNAVIAMSEPLHCKVELRDNAMWLLSSE